MTDAPAVAVGFLYHPQNRSFRRRDRGSSLTDIHALGAYALARYVVRAGGSFLYVDFDYCYCQVDAVHLVSDKEGHIGLDRVRMELPTFATSTWNP